MNSLRNPILQSFHFVLNYVCKGWGRRAARAGKRVSPRVARVDEGNVEVRTARNTQFPQDELGCLAWLPNISETSTIHQQTERKNTDSVFMKVSPNIKV